MGVERIPTIRLDHLSNPEKRAYIIADNRLAELAGWDREILAIELQGLLELDLDFEVEITGFETVDIDLLLEPDIPDRDIHKSPGPLVQQRAYLDRRWTFDLRWFTSTLRVMPVSTISSTRMTCRLDRSMSRSLVIRTPPESPPA